MRILFTNSPLHFTHGHTFTQPDWQTLVLPLLAGIIGDKHEIKLVDNMTLMWRSNIIIDEMRKFKPEIVGFSIIAARDIYNTVRVIKRVRELYPKITLIAGGQGSSFYDELLLKNGINFVVRGEGEITLQELMKNLAEGSADYSAIQGISFFDKEEIKRTVNRQRISNLDDSPFPAFHLMPMRKSRWFPNRFSGSIEMSRGCPFDCNFCAITSFWERSFRQKSNERIIDELKYLVSKGRSHLYLADDSFGMNDKKHINLFEQILKAGLDIRFFTQMRTDTVGLHPEMVALAAKAGLYGALVGFDTYEEEMFHHIVKVGSVELNQKCADTLRQNRIMIFGSHIYGFPEQKRPQDFRRTFWMGRKNSDLFRMPHFSLLPGTKIYGKMITQNIVDAPENDDARLFIRSKQEQKRFKKWYIFFNLLHIFLPDEIIKTLFHPNRNIRKIKQYGYIGILRHYLYRILRKIRLCDI